MNWSLAWAMAYVSPLSVPSLTLASLLPHSTMCPLQASCS